MIRLDLKNKIDITNLDSMFLKFRPGVDRDGYRVGIVDDNIVCINTITYEVMDYFYDDKGDVEWFNINLIIPNINTTNVYELDRKGRIRKTNSIGNSVMKNTILTRDGYPTYSISLDKTGRNDIRPLVHRLVAKMFIPNYYLEEKPYVDHINKNKLDYSINNLRWVNIIENNNNKTFRKFIGNNLYEAYFDINLTKLDRVFTEEELFKSDYTKHTIRDYVTKGNPFYKGRYWRIRNLDIEEYLCGESLDNSQWITHFSGRFMVHPLGLIKGPTNIITLGAKDRGYRTYNNYSVHRVVAEVFLNDNKKLENSLFVDHLDTNSLNNRVSNLRICTRKENMNNPITNQAMKKRVIAEGVIYNSISECAKAYGLTRQAITFRINSPLQSEFNFI